MEKTIFEMHQLSRKNVPTMKKTTLKSVRNRYGKTQYFQGGFPHPKKDHLAPFYLVTSPRTAKFIIGRKNH